MKLKILAAFFSALILLGSWSAVYAAVPQNLITVILETNQSFDTSVLNQYDILRTYNGIFNGYAVRMTPAKALKLMNTPGIIGLSQSADRKITADDSSEDNINLSNGKIITARQILDTELDGTGTTAAVIDAGFDISHDMFCLSDETTVIFTRENIDKISADKLTVSNRLKYLEESAYVNAKIPYAFDYFDNDTDVGTLSTHGTHVAGIIGANNKLNKPNGFDGIAPECQLILMKVADDSEKISDYAILGAITDAAALGVDVINISIGETAALSDMYFHEVDYSDILSNVVSDGCMVFCSAGNEKWLGNGSDYGNNSPLASSPDYSTVALPGNIAKSISVASRNFPYTVYSSYIQLSGGDAFTFMNSSAEDFSAKFGGKKLEYVHISGTGTEQDYDGIDVSGKIALIARGQISFTEKTRIAQDAGAIGTLIYNNDPNGENIIMQIDGNFIPAASISYSDGKAMIENSEYEFSVHTSSPKSVVSKSGGQMSDFTSWGPTPSLYLKPDITAWGGDIYSSVPGNSYDLMSGTSMSSPCAAGIALLYKSADVEFASEITASDILMNTAKPILNKETGIEYSPRLQGAGEINLENALNAQILLTYSVSDRPKAELYDKLGSSFEFNINVKNISDEDKIIDVSASLLSDGFYYDTNFGKYFLTSDAYALKRSTVRIDENRLNSNKNSGNFRSYELSVGAGEEKTVTVKVKMSETDKKALGKAFENGYYLEGYVYFTDKTAGNSYSIPYMGFSDDWSKLSIFSTDDKYFNSKLYSTYTDEDLLYAYRAGTNIFTESNIFSRQLCALSPNGDGFGDTIGISLRFLRNAVSFHAEITDETGTVVCKTEIKNNFTKAYKNLDNINSYPFITLWDGYATDSNHYIYPEGQYSLKLYAVPEYGDDKTPQSVCYQFVIDVTKPLLEKYSIIREDGHIYANIAASDSTGIQCIQIYKNDSDENIISEYFESTAPLKNGTVRFDITELLTDETNSLYINIIDYACNKTTDKIIVGETHK